ncbi:MAG: hypothetical protein V3T05_00080 [Myxococcota bacterium]
MVNLDSLAMIPLPQPPSAILNSLDANAGENHDDSHDGEPDGRAIGAHDLPQQCGHCRAPDLTTHRATFAHVRQQSSGRDRFAPNSRNTPIADPITKSDIIGPAMN